MCLLYTIASIHTTDFTLQSAQLLVAISKSDGYNCAQHQTVTGAPTTPKQTLELTFGAETFVA